LPSMQDAAQRYRDLCHESVSALHAEDRFQDALTLCHEILAVEPTDQEFLILASRSLAGLGQAKEALHLLLTAKEYAPENYEIMFEAQRQLNGAVAQQEKALMDNDFDQAFDIIKYLSELLPNPTAFHGLLIYINELRIKKYMGIVSEHNIIKLKLFITHAAAAEEQLDFEAEAESCLQICRHPYDVLSPMIMRYRNIIKVLSYMLRIQKESFSAEDLSIIREMIELSKTVHLTSRGTEYPEHHVREAFYRLQIASIDVDAVFGRRAEITPPLPAVFMDSAGQTLSMEALHARAQRVEAKAIFFASASPEYFQRYAKSFISSTLKACDCGCLVVVGVCCPPEQLRDLLIDFPLHDDRIVLCSDLFERGDQPIAIYSPKNHIHTIPGTYYATSSLFHADGLLQHLRLPMFFMGIDTVLQRGIRDILEDKADADVVLNILEHHASIGEKLVNNLVLVFPTDNGLLFLNFLKQMLCPYVLRAEQAFASDQLFVHLAKHHLVAHGVDPKIAYFDKLDINNVMFDQTNYAHFMDHLKEFRFINIFASGCDTRALSEAQLLGDAIC